MTNAVPPESPLTREERLRRVLLVALTFARNMAYYRAARDGSGRYVGPDSQFGITADGNFIDMATLEWCKLFGGPKEQHDWRKVVTDPVMFEPALLAHIGMTQAEFADYVKVVRTYRDKFVAHLDSERRMTPPDMGPMWSSILYYYGHVLDHEMSEAEADKARAGLSASNLPTDIGDYYRERFSEARAIYRKAQN